MKKLLLVMVFLCTTGTMMNAGTVTNAKALEDEYPGGCVQFAFDLEEFTGELDYDRFAGIVAWCESW